MKVKFKNQEGFADFKKHRSEMGLKTSKKRSLIVSYFMTEDRHFSVEELYHEIGKIKSRIGYSTVYRTLKLLKAFGLASVRNFDDGVLRFEPVHKEQHHDHLVCQKCGRIIEFSHDGIEQFQKDIAKEYKFSVYSHELQIFGLCRSCHSKQQKKQRKRTCRK